MTRRSCTLGILAFMAVALTIGATHPELSDLADTVMYGGGTAWFLLFLFLSGANAK